MNKFSSVFITSVVVVPDVTPLMWRSSRLRSLPPFAVALTNCCRENIATTKEIDGGSESGWESARDRGPQTCSQSQTRDVCMSFAWTVGVKERDIQTHYLLLP